MRYTLLATDYDGTLAEQGRVDDRTLAALEALRAMGGRLILATGRHIRDVKNVCPRLDLFDRVLGEDGAVLYRPGTNETFPLAPPPSPELLAALDDQGVPFDSGYVVVSSETVWQREIQEVLDAIAPDWSIHLNKGRP